jgi:hypothetical protein
MPAQWAVRGRGPEVGSLSGQVHGAERAAATSLGVGYVDITPWLCSATCTAVVGKYEAYLDEFHITASYSFFVEPLLIRVLHLPSAP